MKSNAGSASLPRVEPHRRHRSAWRACLAGVIVVAGLNSTPAPAGPVVEGVFVAPGGVGDGSLAAPMSLRAALAAGGVGPGVSVWLREGVYGGCFEGRVAGAPGRPVVFRPYPGEHVVLDGAGCTKPTLELWGSDVWVWGLEVTNSDPRRGSADTAPADIGRPTGVTVYGPRTKLINLVVHDTGSGISLWNPAVDSEIYGAVLFNNGWLARDRGHGHGIYTQNSQGTKTIAEVVSVNNYATGMKAFGEKGSAVGYRFEGVIAANNGSPAALSPTDAERQANLLVGTRVTPSDDITITNAYLYSTPGTYEGAMWLGWQAPENGTVVLKDSYIATGAQALKLVNWRDATVTGNTFYTTATAVPMFASYLLRSYTPPGTAYSAYNFDNNTYHDTSRIRDNGAWSVSGRLNFNQWKSLNGHETASTYTDTAPTATRVFIRPNRYEPGRANIAIFNWDHQPTITIDLAPTGLRPGQHYEIRNAENWTAGPIATGTYTGEPTTITLTPTRAHPTGSTNHTPTTNEFTALIVTPL